MADKPPVRIPSVRDDPGAFDAEQRRDLAWAIVEEMSLTGARLLEPIFVRHGGRKGRLSIQTDPTLHGSTERMLDQARHFHTLAPNVQIKFPATAAGLAAIEQATYDGMTITATVSPGLMPATRSAAATASTCSRNSAYVS